jgi:hypothetical protein
MLTDHCKIAPNHCINPRKPLYSFFVTKSISGKIFVFSITGPSRIGPLYQFFKKFPVSFIDIGGFPVKNGIIAKSSGLAKTIALFVCFHKALATNNAYKSKPAAGSVYLETEESRREREWHPQPIMGRWHLQPNMALQAIPRLTELFAADVNDMPKDHHQSSSHKSWGKHLLPLQRTTLHHPPITRYQSPRTLKKRRLL